MAKKSHLDALKLASTRADLAKLLRVKKVFLTNVLYRIGTDTQYNQFKIPKKNGGHRIISAPTDRLKDLQRHIADLLITCRQEIFESQKIENNLSHGFEKRNSIITNAFKHRGKKAILNIDLHNFFESFNFGRVRGYFIHNRNFELHPVIATTLAKAACYKQTLPQGSPCSPVITNLICSILDIRLAKIAKELGCTYSRYADDITFSTNKRSFPEDLAIESEEGTFVGDRLKYEIKKAGFEINDQKTRLSYKPSRQEVTGLTVNKIVNVNRRYAKNIRALSHALYKTGEYLIPNKKGEMVPGTINQLEGMFGFIDQIDKFNNRRNKLINKPEKYVLATNKLTGYRLRLNSREKAYSKFIYFKNFHGNSRPTIIPEGKTDIVYLKCALHSLMSKHLELFKEGKKKDEKEINLNIFNPETKSGYFLDISGGTANILKFIKRYESEYTSYYGTDAKHPVIIVLDNDSGSDCILNHLKDKVKNCPDNVEEMRKKEFIYVFLNLYIVLTPLTKSGAQTAMEDLFPKELLSVELDGKKFNKTNNTNTNTEYGKHFFSTRVVKDKNIKINFEGFNPVINNIKKAIKHYTKLSIRNKKP